VLLVVGFLRLVGGRGEELRTTARLLSSKLAPLTLVRVCLTLGGALLPSVFSAAPGIAAALALALCGQVVGRYLFFVSVVPTHMTTPYLAREGEAA
jgi:hypothetical protein